MTLTSSNGTPITVRPIEPEELEHIVLRCWPEEREILERLFAEQGTIGMAAWEGDECVGQLHCYRVALPDGRNESWPEWNGWWPNPTWWSQATRKTDLELSSWGWCHACCHVGRTLERASVTDEPDHRYFGRGIGTALCKTSVSWAREYDYAAVLALGAPDRLFEYAVWSGHLPWITYAKLGFEILGGGKVGWDIEEGNELPSWAQGDSPPEVMAEVRAALTAGRPADEIRERPMVLHLSKRTNALSHLY